LNLISVTIINLRIKDDMFVNLTVIGILYLTKLHCLRMVMIMNLAMIWQWA